MSKPTFYECVDQLHEMMRDFRPIYETIKYMQRNYGFCEFKLAETAEAVSPDIEWKNALLETTPKTVWERYAADGYARRQALEEECLMPDNPVTTLPNNFPEVVGRKIAELSECASDAAGDIDGKWLNWQIFMGDFLIAQDALEKLDYQIVRKP